MYATENHTKIQNLKHTSTADVNNIFFTKQLNTTRSKGKLFLSICFTAVKTKQNNNNNIASNSLLLRNHIDRHNNHILGDPGTVAEGEKKSKLSLKWRRKYRQRKVGEKARSLCRWGRCLSGQVQTSL